MLVTRAPLKHVATKKSDEFYCDVRRMNVLLEYPLIVLVICLAALYLSERIGVFLGAITRISMRVRAMIQMLS